MGLLKSLFTNCANPQGRMGRAMLKFMNLCHAPLTNWGLSHIDFEDGWTMLDIGCGGGATLRRLLKRSDGSRVYGIDISEESVAKAKKVNEKALGKQVFVQQGSVESLPYEDGMFDLVTAVESVYFWPNLPSCLANEEHGVGFYKVTTGTTLAAGKAYLSIPGNEVKLFYGFDFNDATAIKPINDEQGTISVYNLRGQQISNSRLPQGVIILNNKKVVNK